MSGPVTSEQVPQPAPAPRSGRRAAIGSSLPSTVPSWLKLTVYVAIVSVVMLAAPFRLGGGVVIADAFLVVSLVAWFVVGRSRGQDTRLLRQLAPWIWLLALAQLVGLSQAGPAVWGLTNTMKNTAPFVVVGVVFALFTSEAGFARRAWQVWMATAVLASATVLMPSAGVRAVGVFGNPAYPAHYLALTLICVLWRERGLLRIAIALVLGLALLRTGSFTPFTMLAAAGAYVVWSVGSRFEPSLRILVRTVLLIGVVLCAFWVVQGGGPSFEAQSFDAGNGLSGQRLQRSGDARLEIWESGVRLWMSRPIGYGPGYVAAQKLDGNLVLAHDIGEVHQEVLELLIGGGPVALLAAFMGCRIIWKRGRQGGLTRTLLIAALMASVFRQTLNFRHTALLLALSLAYEYWSERRAEELGAADHIDAEPVEPAAPQTIVPETADLGSVDSLTGSTPVRTRRRSREAWAW